ncbi:hypothetical protein EG327_011563 [Venturia inaequalis]|uniref:Chromatin modification-related protein EAF3 n=1 Tax=Venturia inaequalis TaxID=5025 RepID=A0A8H3YR79_VENIN|nr:hypothetical protein EG327_011563 [Venturia inaequalis]
MAPAVGPAFEKDEKVLCFHHDLLYEAKVLDTRQSDDKDKKSPWEFLIHYKGWKNTWDDWVPADRLRKHNDANLDLARGLKKELERVAQASKPKKDATGTKRKPGASGRGSEERHSTPSLAAGKKRGRDQETEKEEQYRAKPAIRLFIPDILKSVLVDDWEQITSKGNFVVLPSKTPIEMILDDYNQHRKEQSDYVYSDLFEESLKGLKAYADIAIPRRLLYRQERRIENGVESQYLHIAKRMKTEGDELFGKRIHQVFGCEHFLRQLTHMPQLVAQTNMDDQSITRIRNEITALLLWLARDEQIKKYLSAAYRPWACELQH